MKYTADQLLAKASEFEQMSSKFVKTANSFVDTVNNYDSAPAMIDDLVESLKISAYKGYEDGKGFPKEVFELLLKQAEIIATALEPVKAELAAIDEKIYQIV